MDLDLNQEPLESPDSPTVGLTPLLNELETVHSRIEERIRQLEAVTARIRERQMSRQGQGQSTTQVVDASSEATTTSIYDLPTGRLVQSGKICKMDGTRLIAEALGEEKTSSNSMGGYFDCNICLERARDPVLTCCGHLFCWPCFYQLPYSYSNVKECPVCEGEVCDNGIVPIYGNGSDSNSSCKTKSKESHIDVPPRPHAKRIESVRQKLITNRIPSLPMEETIQHMRRLIDAIGQRSLSQGIHTGISNSLTSGEQQNQSLEVENLDGSIDGTNTRRDRREISRGGSRNSISSFDAVVQRDIQSLGTAELITVVPVSAGSARGFGIANIVVQTGTQNADPGTEIVSAVPSTSSPSRRRTEVSDVERGAWNRYRRRRLR